jgi:ABC-type glycerol-3-phosphate transport system substrate-binding protein
MKKITLVSAIFATVALVACGSGSATTQKTDSASVSTDTTAKATDSTSTNGGVKTEETVK